MKYPETVSFKTTEEQADIIHEITAGTNISASEIIRRGIDVYLRRIYSDILDEKSAKRLDEYLHSLDEGQSINTR